MLASFRTASFLCLVLFFGILAMTANCAPVTSMGKRRSVTDAEIALATLQGLVDTYTSTFVPGASTDELTTALTAINASVAIAYAAIITVPATKRDLSIRADDLDTLGTVLGNIISTLITDVEAILVEAEALPLLGSLIADIDGGLVDILNAVEALLAGVLVLVSELLTAVVGMVGSLALSLFFTGVASTLGI